MKIKITFFFLLFVLTSQLMYAQSGCSQVYYLDDDNDGFGTTAVFGGETNQNYGSGQYLGSWGHTVNFSTALNNLVSFNYSITNTAAMSQCIFRFYSGANQVASVEAYPQNGETFNTVHNFTAPLFDITSVVVYSYWNPAYLNSLTFLAIPSSVVGCSQPAGYALNSTDCNDDNAAVNPSIFDICNAIDDNCDGQVDNGMYYADADGDGYGVSPNIITQENATVTITSDLIVLNGSNDLNGSNGTDILSKISFIVPTTTTYTFDWSYVTNDYEGPGYDPAYYINNVLVQLSNDNGNNLQSGSVSINVTAGSTFGFAVVSSDGGGGQASLTISNFNGISNVYGGSPSCVAPSGYVTNHSDCNDNLTSINPAAIEMCNSFDDDCDTQVDESVQNTYFEDKDGDGYGENPGAITQGNSVVVVNDNEIIIIGNDPFSGDHLQGSISFVVPQNATYTFDWSYSTVDESPEWDPSYYINNVSIPLSIDEGANSQSGSVSVAVTAGSTFGFSVVSVDGEAGNAKLTISNFNGMSNLRGGISACSPPGVGYVTNNDDCNDSKNIIHPDLSEVCNYYDDNCDGQVDEGLNTYYADNDGDGFGAGPATITCVQDDGFVLNNNDCNDNSVAIKPSGTELCNGVDENCNGQVDDGLPLITRYLDSDGDGYGNLLSPSSNCSGTFSSNYVVNSLDCNDSSASVNPDASEVCNDADDNCNAQVDEGVQSVFYADLDNDGFGSSTEALACISPLGFVANNWDCNDGSSTIFPGATEVCNDVDDNCDGQIDEGVNTYFADTDGDGFGAGSAVITCNPSSGFVSSNNDCNDNESTIYPGAAEICNNIDDNCDTQIDEGALNTYYVDTDGDGYGADAVTESFAPGAWVLYTPSAFVLVGTPDYWIGVSNKIQFVAPTTETYTFNWAYAVLDDPDQDPAYYFINDQIVVLSDEWGALYQSGSVSVTVNAGDVFGFGINSWDDEAGPVWLEITNFNARSYMGIAVGCSQPTGYAASNIDCDNANTAVNPGATEVCNTIDDNCDSEIDEGVQNTYYVDADLDGFGGNITAMACAVSAGYSANNSDCDEGVAAVNPGASELCNGIDDNCNGQLDEGVQSTFYLDDDSDGFGTSEVFSGETNQNYGSGQYLGSWGLTVNFPTALNNLVSFNYSITNTAAMSQCIFRFYNGANQVASVEVYPQNGQTISTGYNFSSPLFNITSVQVFSYWNPAYLNSLTFQSYPSSVVACVQPVGYASSNTDCNDSNASVNSGMNEICNTIDDDCDGQVDNANYYIDADADGYGDAGASGVQVCLATSDYVINNDDCNDAINAVHPGATEVCNSLDDNCDTQIDEGVQNNYYADSDSDGFGAGTATLACAAPTGFVASNTDCNNNDGAVYPGAIEVCNNVDDNCDAQIDEDVQNIYYSDADGDGFGAGSETAACVAPTGFVSTNTDCNNNDALVYPGATELCNSVDDDCDTQIDEGVQISYYADADGDGFGSGVATLACSAPIGMVASNTDCNDAVAAIKPGATESCNGIDDDCDGGIDEFGTSPVAQVVTSCGPYTWNETNATYSSSGTYYSNIPVASTYNSLASFTSASSIVGYQVSETEDFSEFSGYTTSAIGNFGNSFPSWTASAISGFYFSSIDGSTVITSNQFASPLTFNFSPGVTGVGGNFYVTDVMGGLMNRTITFSLSDGTNQSVVINSYDSFTGFISNGALITSITVNSAWMVGSNPYVQVDNLVVTTGTPVYSCSTEILELVVNTPVYYYADIDSDGFGGEEDSLSCTQPTGFVLNNGDCNDNFALVYPVAFEVCNNIDDNCNGVADEGVQTMYFADNDGDTYGEMADVILACVTPPGYVESAGDCNDNNPAINPSTSEICNLIDDNCNGFADEGVGNVYFLDSDNDGYGDLAISTISCSAPASFVENYSDCDDTNASVNPSAAEICNGIDDNCADGIDNGLQFNNYYTDADGDNFGVGAAQSLCANPGAGYSSQLGDCNDSSSAIKPGASEICGNGIDEDCSGTDLTCPSTGGISASVSIVNIGTYNTGVQTNMSINLNNGTDTPENPGAGKELWFNFTAQSNAVRIQLTGSNLVNDDNDLSLFDEPSVFGSALIPLVSENDVHPGSLGASADGGNEVLLFDGLTIGNDYFVCVRNNNNSAGNVSMRIAYLHGSQSDIALYTNNTGLYANTCQNFKVKFRAGAASYTVNRYNLESNALSGNVSDWTYAIPSGASASSVCQLGKIVPPNLGNSNRTYFVTVDVHYNLLDAFGNVTPITGLGHIVGSFTLTPEAPLTVRNTDQCPYFKALTSSVVTNRSICGVTQYNWEFTQVVPSVGIPFDVNGNSGGSRILPVSSILGVALGNTYNVRIRGKFADNSYTAYTSSPACVRTIGSSGLPTLESENEYSSIQLNGATIALYPSLNQGEMVNLSVSDFEGNLSVEILDATGRLIQAENVSSEGAINKVFVFNSTLSNGLYHVKVSSGSSIQTLRFVVSK